MDAMHSARQILTLIGAGVKELSRGDNQQNWGRLAQRLKDFTAVFTQFHRRLPTNDPIELRKMKMADELQQELEWCWLLELAGGSCDETQDN